MTIFSSTFSLPRRKEDKDLSLLKEEIAGYYTFGPFKPKVEIQDDLITVEIDTSAITSQKSDFDIAIKYCETGKFNKAKPILEKLIKKNPTVSEYHRILGQIYSDEGRHAAYGKKSFASDAERVAFLFELYHKYTSLLPGLEMSDRQQKKRRV